jgi:hypothetical protein
MAEFLQRTYLGFVISGAIDHGVVSLMKIRRSFKHILIIMPSLHIYIKIYNTSL